MGEFLIKNIFCICIYIVQVLVSSKISSLYMIVWRIKSIGESSVYGRIFNKKYLLYKCWYEKYHRCI